MKTRTAAAISVAGVVILEAAGLLVLVETGAYNVGATSPHSKVVAWLLGAASERSIAVRAGRLTPPASALKAKGSEGFEEFDGNLCSMCHGAPGAEPSGIAKGLYPPPPDLSKAARFMSMAEIYWVIAHGIGDSGMPAFQAGHKDEELWMIASYVKRLGGQAADQRADAKTVLPSQRMP
jgi:mono/diheme cytochrome c family protein